MRTFARDGDNLSDAHSSGLYAADPGRVTPTCGLREPAATVDEPICTQQLVSSQEQAQGLRHNVCTHHRWRQQELLNRFAEHGTKR